MKRGLIINNIGTPASPSTADVKTYLDEFLMDPGVISLPFPIRFLLVRGLITPRRSPQSAAKYAKIWTERGSPLMFHTRDFVNRLSATLGDDWMVRVGMRYGSPSIADALDEFKREGVEEVVLAPMFPQNADATTGSAVEEFQRTLKAMKWSVPVSSVAPFYDFEGFLGNQAEAIRPYLKESDHLVFSFHGLPESHLRKIEGCLRSPDCCDRPKACATGCYRAQSLATARSLAGLLGLPPNRWTMSFQSRLGPAKWIGPSTDETLADLAQQGVGHVVVACPSFVADCLETLEEIGLEARKEFLAAGGKSFKLVPCLNSDPEWAESFARLVANDPRKISAKPVPAGPLDVRTSQERD